MSPSYIFFFFLNDPAPPEIYPLPLHAALPIPAQRGRDDEPVSAVVPRHHRPAVVARDDDDAPLDIWVLPVERSEEHTSELQSQSNLVCRLLLEKKKNVRFTPS